MIRIIIKTNSQISLIFLTDIHRLKTQIYTEKFPNLTLNNQHLTLQEVIRQVRQFAALAFFQPDMRIDRMVLYFVDQV